MPRRDADQGFTLVEMMIVVGLLGMLVAVSVPSVQGYLRANQLDVSCDQLRADLAFARSVAVMQGESLSFDGDASAYTITYVSSGEVLRERSFDSSVEFDGTVQAGFYPWGAADATVLNLGNGRQTRNLNILPTGIVEEGS